MNLHQRLRQRRVRSLLHLLPPQHLSSSTQRLFCEPCTPGLRTVRLAEMPLFCRPRRTNRFARDHKRKRKAVRATDPPSVTACCPVQHRVPHSVICTPRVAISFHAVTSAILRAVRDLRMDAPPNRLARGTEHVSSEVVATGSHSVRISIYAEKTSNAPPTPRPDGSLAHMLRIDHCCYRVRRVRAWASHCGRAASQPSSMRCTQGTGQLSLQAEAGIRLSLRSSSNVAELSFSLDQVEPERGVPQDGDIVVVRAKRGRYLAIRATSPS